MVVRNQINQENWINNKTDPGKKNGAENNKPVEQMKTISTKESNELTGPLLNLENDMMPKENFEKAK